jgi:hypothetical protein
MSESKTAVARMDGVVSIGERARGVFTDSQMKLIKDTVAKDCSVQELHMFLELCARYELDPFAKEIYAAKMGSRSGEGGRVAIIVGRDGMLKVAQRSGEFEGIAGDVVRFNDEFSKDSVKDLPDHIIRGHALPPDDTGKYPEGSRGPIVGAWATVYRRGRKPTYFYAPLNEYKPTGNKLTYSPWSNQESAMILKCAESTALRKAFSINGVVGEEEMSRALERDAQDIGMTEWGSDPTLAAWLPQLFAAANALREDAYRPAKVRMMLRGKDDEARELLAQDLVQYLTTNGGVVPPRPSLESLTDEVEVEASETEVVHQGDEPEADVAADDGSLFPHPDDPDVHRGDV